MPQTLTSISPVTICTLWENDYHKGLGTLVNSLVRAGYRGRVWAGYRGGLPNWAAVGITKRNICSLSVADGVDLLLYKIDANIHFAQYKARWMNQVLTQLEPDSEGIYYFDPDIFILGKWTFFEHWLRCGIALCEDQSYPINPTHPLVRLWQEYAIGLGHTQWNGPSAYLNSGLVGVTRERRSFLYVWQDLMDAMQRDFSLGKVLKTGTRVEMFHQTDQDALTVTTAISLHPISLVSVDGMAFDRGQWLTLHALSKPWRRRVFRDWLVEGHRPDSALRLYWELARGPIQVETAGRARRHKLYVPLVALLGRFYNR